MCCFSRCSCNIVLLCLFCRKTGCKRKLNTYIQFPEILDMSPYVSKPCEFPHISPAFMTCVPMSVDQVTCLYLHHCIISVLIHRGPSIQHVWSICCVGEEVLYYLQAVLIHLTCVVCVLCRWGGLVLPPGCTDPPNMCGLSVVEVIQDLLTYTTDRPHMLGGSVQPGGNTRPPHLHNRQTTHVRWISTAWR